MSKQQFQGNIGRLRLPERLARLEVSRIVALCLAGISVDSVLDIGTGTGVFAEAFMPLVSTVTGIDLNPEMVAAAKKYVPEATFQQGSAESIPSADNAYDLAFLGLMLHETDDQSLAIREAKRCARTRVAVLEWPYPDEPTDPPPARRVNPDDVTTFAQQAGFRTIETFPLTDMVLYRFTV